jgi:pyridoxal phosphate enzyme (YggS family)
MSVTENLLKIKSTIPNKVTLVAVSKTKPNAMIIEAYNEQQRHFGENKVQDLVGKYETLPKDIKWHFIGHLQTNKVKYIAPFVHLIHAVDGLKLLKEINKQGLKNDKIIDVLIQFHIAQEESKFGLSFDDAVNLLKTLPQFNFTNVRIIGVMGMATFTDNKNQVKKEFKTLQQYFTEIKQQFFSDVSSFKEISMGMSGDYQIAIKEGSTMVRVGSSIFGKR